MRKLFGIAAANVLLATLTLPAGGAPRVGHVFIISIDGGKPAVIAQSDMPVLKGLAAQGACTWTAQTIFPSITLPSHTSMLTGVGPEKHQILWNTWKPRAGVVQVPTVFSEAKKLGLSTAMFVGKEKFRHLLQPGTVDEFDFDKSQAGLVVTSVVGQAARTKTKTVLAKTVAQHAAAYIRQQKPNLCFIHFTDPDDAGHQYGWGSQQQIKAFEDVDAALAEILKASTDAGIIDDLVVLVTADHGGHKKTHGSKQAEDMTIPWLVWGKGVKANYTIIAPVITYDTAATALWLLDVPCPDTFDGRPVFSAFKGENANVQAPKPAPAPKHASAASAF